MASITWSYNGGEQLACIRNNTATSVTDGSSYTCRIINTSLFPLIPNYPYSIHHFTVLMGGVDVTSDVVSQYTDATVGYPIFDISIPSVSGNLEVNVFYETNPTITWNLVGCDVGGSNRTSIIWWGFVYGGSSPYAKHVVADSGYDLHNSIVSIIMNNVDVTSQFWDNPPEHTQSVEFLVGEVDGDLSISIQAVSTTPRTVTYNLSHCYSSNQATSVQLWDDFTTTITAENGYSLYGATIEILYGGNPYPSAYVDGVITIPKVSQNIVINITAIENPTFRFYNETGTILRQTYQADRLTTLRVELSGNTRYLTLNGSTYTYVGDSIPQGKVFAGYSNHPNATIPTYAVGFDLIVNFSQSTNFYEVIVDEQELGDMMLNLYKNTSENERLDKTNYLTMVNTLYGSFKDVTSITNPSIIIEYGVIDFNYVYIPILNRYYYVEEVISVKNRLWQIRLKVDVLMSYKSIIRQQSGLIGRSASQYSEDLIDSERIVKNNPVVVVREVSTSIFSPDGTGRIVANVVGGD